MHAWIYSQITLSCGSQVKLVQCLTFPNFLFIVIIQEALFQSKQFQKQTKVFCLDS